MKYLNYTVLFSILFLLMFSLVQSQSYYEATYRVKEVLFRHLNTQEKANPINFSDIKGSRYLNECFKNGEYYLNGKSQGFFYLRYNVYDDQVEILEDSSPENLNLYEKNINTFLKYDKSKVVLDGKIIKSYFYYDDNGSISNSYFIEINKTDKLTLLLRKRCVLTPAEKAATPNEPDRTAKFTIYDDYYIIAEREKYPKKIDFKTRKLVKEFPNHGDALKSFIKKENIDLGEESDLVKLTNYMSTF